MNAKRLLIIVALLLLLLSVSLRLLLSNSWAANYYVVGDGSGNDDRHDNGG